MNTLTNFFKVIGEEIRNKLYQWGWGEKIDAFDAWRKKGQNNKILVSCTLILLAIIILLMYSCSKQPDL